MDYQNYQWKRLETFFLMKKFTTIEKFYLSKQGFYHDSDRVICYKCDTSYEIGSEGITTEINTHRCRDLLCRARNIQIPSPYINSGSINVQNGLSYEEYRYATFVKYKPEPTIKMSSLEMASAGFYYAISPNILKCFYCKTVIDRMNFPNHKMSQHKYNKNCLQKKISFQIRINSINPHFPPFKTNDRRRSLTTTTSEAAGRPITYELWAIGQIQKAFNEFVKEPKTKSFYKAALNLGFEKQLVDEVVKRRIQSRCTFNSKQELIEICLMTFNNDRHGISPVEANKSGGDAFKREMECKICMNEKISVVFKPCHHVVSCAGCGSKLKRCPMCCARIEKCSKVYL